MKCGSICMQRIDRIFFQCHNDDLDRLHFYRLVNICRHFSMKTAALLLKQFHADQHITDRSIDKSISPTNRLLSFARRLAIVITTGRSSNSYGISQPADRYVKLVDARLSEILFAASEHCRPNCDLSRYGRLDPQTAFNYNQDYGIDACEGGG